MGCKNHDANSLPANCIRRQAVAGGVIQVVKQCPVCFQRVGGCISKETLHRLGLNPSEIPFFDEAKLVAKLEEEERERHSAILRKREQDAREISQFWNTYDAYLQTPEWANRRARVLLRDNHTCQAGLPGCTTRASQAHHRSYRHLRNEPLFELVAVCQSCHQKITDLDRSKLLSILDIMDAARHAA